MHTDNFLFNECSKWKIVEKLIKTCPCPYSVILTLKVNKLLAYSYFQKAMNHVQLFIPFSQCTQYENQKAHLCQQPHGCHVLSEHSQDTQSATLTSNQVRGRTLYKLEYYKTKSCLECKEQSYGLQTVLSSINIISQK